MLLYHTHYATIPHALCYYITLIIIMLYRIHYIAIMLLYYTHYDARNQSQKTETSHKKQKPVAKRSGTFAEHSPQPKARQGKKGI